MKAINKVLYDTNSKKFYANVNGSVVEISNGNGGSGGGGSSDYPPEGGIPASDLSGDIPAEKLSKDVQSSLNKANSAYQKPSTGIPSTDLAGGITNAQLAGSISYTKLAGSIPATKLASAVQTTLGKAETAVQPTALTDLFASIVYDSTTNRFNFYGKGDTSHTTPLAYIEASQLGGIADNLDTNDASMGLSAKQGYILRTAIDSLATALANLAFNGEKPTMPWDEQSVPEGDISNYVQDGLVFHLDGINKGETANAWTDLIGSVDFPNHGATSVDKGWHLDGTNDYLGYIDDIENATTQQYAAGAKDLAFSNRQCTIEVCFYKDVINVSAGAANSGVSICDFGTVRAEGVTTMGFLGVYSGGKKYINKMYAGDANNVYEDKYLYATNAHTISMNKTRAFDNANAISSLGVTHWSTNTGGRFIGAAMPVGGPNMFFGGTVYAIRIYNRILTELEMRQNQRVDNARFELGLTLPE